MHELPRASEVDWSNPPPWVEACSEFLAAKRDIEIHGIQGWMALYGVEPHPALPEALAVFDGELERLRHEFRVAQVEKARQEAKRKKKR